MDRFSKERPNADPFSRLGSACSSHKILALFVSLALRSLSIMNQSSRECRSMPCGFSSFFASNCSLHLLSNRFSELVMSDLALV